MKESASSILLRHYLKAHPWRTCSLEVKTTNGSLPFTEVTEAQLDYAIAIKSDKGVLIRTQAVSEGMPDYIYLRSEPAWIIIHYVKSGFVFISPGVFILEKKRSKRRSLTWSRACDIAVKVIVL